ncbi:hypothetical protein CLOM_g21581 [Closterium sp. NIES-68]|nr:hypothetical protein CLOM_g21581 [Closterium sp. NIES-68]GJP71364.1 hypothetical protein CLOP_g2203 [Closterium sp. NIES-67]
MASRSIAAAVLAPSPLPPVAAASRQGAVTGRSAGRPGLLGTRAAAASSAAGAERSAASRAAAKQRRGTNRGEVVKQKRSGLIRVAHLSASDGAQPSAEAARAVWAEALVVGPVQSVLGGEEGGESAERVEGEVCCAGGSAQQEGQGARGDGLAGQGGAWTEADEAELIARAVGGAVAQSGGMVCAGAGDAEAAWVRLGAEGNAGVSLRGKAEAEGEGRRFALAQERLELERAQLELAMRESRGGAERRAAQGGETERGEAERAKLGGEAGRSEGEVVSGEAEPQEGEGLCGGAEDGREGRDEGSSGCAPGTGLLVGRRDAEVPGAAEGEQRAEGGGRCDASADSSDDERLVVADRPPAFPAALNSLYLAFVFNCFVEHAWRFTGAALLALLHDSLLPVAVASFASQLAVFVAAPLVGDIMDSAPRVLAFNVISCIQTAAMVAAVLATMAAVHAAPGAAGQTGAALMRRGWFAVLVVAGAVERITGIASGVAFERDWVILLAGQDNAAALANANAMLRRADLFCDVAGPLVFGWLLSAFSPIVCLHASLATMLASLPTLIVLVLRTDRQSKGVLSRPKAPSSAPGAPELVSAASPLPELSQTGNGASYGSSGSGTSSRRHRRSNEEGAAAAWAANAARGTAAGRTFLAAASATPLPLLLASAVRAVVVAGVAAWRAVGSVVGLSVRSVARGWRSFLGQPVLAVSVAYVLLFFNCVLSPGGLITSFLTQQGVDVSVIGAFRGACAAMGFAATFLSPLLITRVGLLQAGGAALLFQSVVLALSLAVFAVSHSMRHHHSLLLAFLALIVVSRLGHWTYDVVDAQIFQVAIPPAQANIVGTTEVALASLAELVMLALAIIAHDVQHFGLLAGLSAAAVFAAAAIYCTWERSANHHRRSLFPPEPRLRWPWRRGKRGRRGKEGRGEGAGTPAAPAA